jgi:effector-binding domain-containing protein
MTETLKTIEEPHIVQTETLIVAKLYAKVPTSQIQTEMGKLLQEVIAEVEKQGIALTGPWFTHHFRRPDDFFDFEVCMPVVTPIQPAGRVQPGEWPAMKVVRTVYRGNYSGLPAAWGEFMQWIDGEGLKISPEIWERYLINPNTETNPAKWTTELNRPLV